MKKKLFVFLMAFFMVAALCCGCASNANNLYDNKTQTIIDVDQNEDNASTLDEEQTNIEETEDDDQLESMASGDWTSYTETPSKYGNTVYIYNEKQLAFLVDKISAVGDDDDHWRKITIYLEADLDMSAHYWNKPIGTSDGAGDNSIFGWSWNFKGKFYGRGHTIYGLYTDSWKFNCLFGSINGATIQDLNVVGHYNATYDWWNGCMPCGGIVSRAWNSTIKNCTFDGKITTASDFTSSVGGIVGYMEGGNIDSCINYATMKIEKASYVGGLVGQLVKGDIDNSVNLCNFTSLSAWTGALGGIVGYSDQGGGKVTDSANYATISTSYTGNNVGGIVGKFVNNYRIDRCINYGNVSASNSKNVGGIIGSLGGEYTEWFQTKYRGTNALTNCISYGSVNGKENAGSVVGLIYCDVMRGCYGRNFPRFGSWVNGPSDYTGNRHAYYYTSISSYQTESFLKSHSYDYSGTLNGFSCGSWSGAYSSWWTYNSAIYDFLDGRYNTGDSTTISNIKYSSHYTCAVPKGITGTFEIRAYYKKNGSRYNFDANDNYISMTSRTASESYPDNTYCSLKVDYLYSAPYSKGYSWSMNIFTISNSSNFTLDTSDYYYSNSYSSYKCYSISPEKYNSTCAAVRFASCDGAYRAPNEYNGAGYIDLKFTAKEKSVTFSSNVSGCKIKYNGTEISSKSYYYRDSLAGISVTPRLGYYLAEVKDNYHSGALYTGTTLGTINLSTKSDWYRYSLTTVTCTFKPVTYSVSVYYDGRLVDNSKTWTIGQKDNFVVSNDTFSSLSVLPFGYNYAYNEYSMIYGSSKETRKNTLSSSYYDMDTSVSGKQSSSAMYVESGEKRLKTSIQDFLNGATLYDSSGTNVTTNCLKSNELRLYLSASSIQYTLDMFKGFEDENESTGNIPGKTGASIKVYNSSGTLLKNYPESVSDGVTDSITFNTDSSYTIKVGAYRGYQVLGYRIHITPKLNPANSKPSDIEYEKNIKYCGERGDGSAYFDITDLSSIYTLNEQIIQNNGEDLFIKGYLTNAFQYMKKNNKLFDFSEANLAKYYDFYIKVVYEPLKYNIGFKVDGTGKTLSKKSENDLNSSVAWRELELKDSNNNTDDTVTVKITAKNYLKTKNDLTSVYYYDSVTITAKETVGTKRFLGIYLGDKLMTTKNVYTFIVDPNKFGSDNNKISGLTFNVKYSNAFETTSTTKAESHIYEISSADDLRWLSKQVENGISFEGYIFNQIQDIDMHGVKFKPIGDGTQSANGTYIHVFKGVYNGNGYRIKNLKFDDENLNYVGLFGNVDGATIKNLTIDGGSFTGYNYVGIFAGRANESKFENIHNIDCHLATTKISYFDIYEKSVTGKTINYTISSSVVEYKTLNGDREANRWWAADGESHSNDVYDLARNSTTHGIGGIVGYAENCNFLAVSMKANVTNGDSDINSVVGAMIGYGTGNTIDQCYAEGTFTRVSSTRQLYSGSATVTNCYITYIDKDGTKTTSYSRDAEDTETRRNAFDIWMELNGEWVLKIFYW